MDDMAAEFDAVDASGDIEDRMGALMERATRKLPLNAPADVIAMRETLAKVVVNILTNPCLMKFRALKVSKVHEHDI